MKLFAAIAVVSCLAGCSPASSGTSDDANDGGGDSVDAGGIVPSPSDHGKTDPPTEPPTAAVDGSSPFDGGSAASEPDASVSADAAPPASDGGTFLGAPPYVATLGPSTLVRKHTVSSDDPAGQPCLSCHTGAKGVTKFLFGGTVYADAAGTKRAASVEVRVRDAAGKAQSAYTDANGNFFFAQGASPNLAAPATAGVRDATTTRLMTNAINDGDCNSCHHSGGEGPLHLL